MKIPTCRSQSGHERVIVAHALQMTQVDQVWEQLFPAEQQRLVRLLVERVIVTPTNLELRLRPGCVGSLSANARQAAEVVASPPDADGVGAGQ